MIFATHEDQVVFVEHGVQGEDVSRGQRLDGVDHGHVAKVSGVLHVKLG